MSEWQGFDQRKVCPQCGEYQTGFRISERRSGPQDLRSNRITLIIAISLILLLVVFTVVMAIVKGASFKSPQVIILFFSLFIILGSGGSRIVVTLLNARSNPSLADKPFEPGEHPTYYRLYCRNCRYEWEMTIDEWDHEAQVELQKSSNK
jgi:hypothetical protein